MSRNKREGHYWCFCSGKFLRFPEKARYKYKKQKTINKCIAYNPLHESDKK